MNNFKIFLSAILAGISISVAAFGNLILGGIPGAVLFAFGLITICTYRMLLYTGYVGNMKFSDIFTSFLILFGNLVGCFLVSFFSDITLFDVQSSADKIVNARLSVGAIGCGLLAIGCGFIIESSVNILRDADARKCFVSWLPLIFGIPLFILCGFPHCVADGFYYFTASRDLMVENISSIIMIYIFCVAGNVLGGNLYRIFLHK